MEDTTITTDDAENLWDSQRLATYLNLPLGNLYRRIRRGDAPPMIRLGPQTFRWRRADVEEWVSQRRTTETANPSRARSEPLRRRRS
jgi:predicted DNA-binding transcriptional regulator AlpA